MTQQFTNPKDELKASRDRELALLTEAKVKAEAELLLVQSKVSSVYAFRPIIELSCSKWNNNSSELGASVAKYIATYVQPGNYPNTPGPTLSRESRAVLNNLAIDNNMQSEVAMNLKQLYNKLSEPFHKPPSNAARPYGFRLGGDAGIRYATALVVLKLQKIPGNDGFPKTVFLLDGDDKPPTHVLLSGEVVPYDPNETY